MTGGRDSFSGPSIPTAYDGRPRQRASQACLPCHRRKLKCSGDWPCKRCATSSADCQYVQGVHAPGPTITVAQDRLQQLEQTVSTLVSAMASANETRSNVSDYMQLPPQEHQPALGARTSSHATAINLSPHAISPQCSPQASVSTAGAAAGTRVGKHQAAEERLELATKRSFEPPFRALTYAPAVWENKEASRMASPEPGMTGIVPDPSVWDHRPGQRRDDPVNTSIITRDVAERLGQFYVKHCHSFLPIIDVSDNIYTILSRSPALFSCVMAIAARYYDRYNAHWRSTGPLIGPTARSRLVNLAFFHLGQTLLSKRHTLEDVQANLLVAAWSIVGEGGGSDAWVTTGHALRLLRRLGVHKELSQVEPLLQVDEDWEKAEALLPQWRAWLAWVGFDTFFSLGYGRPISAYFDAVNKDVLLQMRLRQPLPKPNSSQAISRSGDVYLVAQVELVTIGREVRRWIESQATIGQNGVQIAEMEGFDAKLDEWCRSWIWPGSPRVVHLGASASIATLQAEHLRLCINSYALQSAGDALPSLQEAFNAAVTLISAHSKSSQGDLALSFAIDYHTITVAQAALFLIRLSKAAPAHDMPFTPDVISHYVETVIELLEVGDMSEIRFASFLACTVRDIARVAGVLASPAVTDSHVTWLNDVHSASFARTAYDPSGVEIGHGLPDLSIEGGGEFLGLGGLFDFDAFLQFGGDDLGGLLALPTETVFQSYN